MKYGTCEAVGFTAKNRQITIFRSATRGNWVTIEGIDKTFPDVKTARLYAAANSL